MHFFSFVSKLSLFIKILQDEPPLVSRSDLSGNLGPFPGFTRSCAAPGPVANRGVEELRRVQQLQLRNHDLLRMAGWSKGSTKLQPQASRILFTRMKFCSGVLVKTTTASWKLLCSGCEELCTNVYDPKAWTTPVYWQELLLYSDFKSAAKPLTSSHFALQESQDCFRYDGRGDVPWCCEKLDACGGSLQHNMQAAVYRSTNPTNLDPAVSLPESKRCVLGHGNTLRGDADIGSLFNAWSSLLNRYGFFSQHKYAAANMNWNTSQSLSCVRGKLNHDLSTHFGLSFCRPCRKLAEWEGVDSMDDQIGMLAAAVCTTPALSANRQTFGLMFSPLGNLNLWTLQFSALGADVYVSFSTSR